MSNFEKRTYGEPIIQSNSDEDCISREQAFKCFTWTNTKEDVYYGIKALPPVTPKLKTDVLDKIRAEIEQVKSIMNEEIINHDRKDLINFVNGLNQSLVIIDKYKAESEDKE